MAHVGIIMGSTSDWETMRHAADVLDALGVAHETRVVSAHRTPQRLYDYATGAADRGIRVIIAGAGGAAHLPGMAAPRAPLPRHRPPPESNRAPRMGSGGIEEGSAGACAAPPAPALKL